MNNTARAEQPVIQEESNTGESFKLLSKEEIKYFSQIDSRKFSAAIALELVTIALTIWFVETHWNIFLYAIAVVIIGSRLHGLAILMHDAAHYRGFENRAVNDFVGEVLAWPITLTLQGYRNSHISHHRELNSEKDPEWVRKLTLSEFFFPKTRGEIALTLFQYMSGMKAVRQLADIQKIENSVSVSARVKRARAITFFALLAASIYFSFWKQLLLYWVVPLLTAVLLFDYIRAVADHFCIEYNHPFNQTRTVIAPFWETHLIAPHGINYHIEHHLYPGVPFFRLPELHRRLMQNEHYRGKAHITKGYLTGLLQECIFYKAR